MGVNYNHIPFSPAKFPVYYGWVILFSGTFGVVCSVPAQTIGVSAFIQSLITDTALTRTGVSSAYGLGTICAAAFLTPVGKLYDRIGARRAAILAVAGLSTALLLLSKISGLSLFFLRVLPIRSEQVATFVVASGSFFLLRFLGQGLLTMVSRNMVMKWWEGRAGLANGVIGVFVGLFFSSAPPVFNAFIQAWGWRSTWFVLSVGLAVCLTAFIFLFYRDNPAACGVAIDVSPKRKQKQGLGYCEVDATLREALVSRTYWLYTLSLSLQAFYGTAFSFHVASIFAQIGLSEAVAYRVFIPAAVLSVLLGILAGWISDHIHLKHLLRLQLAGLLISIIGLLLRSGWVSWTMAFIGNGVSFGMFGILLGIAWPRFFGLRHVGAISGSYMTISVFCSALGPAFYAWVLDQFGTYVWANGVCLIIASGLLIASFWRRCRVESGKSSVM